MLLRSLMFLVWALVAGTSVFWGFKLMAQPLPVPAGAAVAAVEATAGGPVSALLGVKRPPPAPLADVPPPAPESSRFQLIGVVAARHASQAQGLALIAVDGKAPRAFRVGAVVDGDLVLQSVLPRAAAIGPRGGVALVSLELPPLPPPATGVPGAVPAQPGVAPVVQGTPMPLQPVQPVPVPLSAPAPAVGPGGVPITNLMAPARLRGQRFATQPGGADSPAAGVPPHEAVQPADTVPPVDHRQQR